ncbi:MAG: beta-N-acetylglucosaminidase domain-containing protein [Oleiphilaceae bacterium]|nr:beta-N-acetylglucosaminidase domain-containing protein [Oleiphilaceae bacterium]
MVPELGIIEGFYRTASQPEWHWSQRRDLVGRLAPAGFGFYLYAPKGDESLRGQWRRPFTPGELSRLADFAAFCRDAGWRFGVGLSPLDALDDFDSETRQALEGKLAALDRVGIVDLALLFDDAPMSGASPARDQARLAHWVAERSQAQRLFVCPSYYSDDPMLDRLYGQRPADYLDQLGHHLDPAIQVFWAGEEICPHEIRAGHLREVARRLGRKPFLWDNYPVNDGARMSRHLHLRGFTGRGAELAGEVAGHGINPALQPTLTAIPALTLPALYRLGEEYGYAAATREAMETVLGEPLAALVSEDLQRLQDTGLEGLGAGVRERLRARYAPFQDPAAREIRAWLEGAYQVVDVPG